MTTSNDSDTTSNHHRVRRNYKDGLFRLLFFDKEGALELYNALNGFSYGNPDLIGITTIDDAIYMGIKNDLSFLIKDQMHLLEAQSSWSPNMPLRGLFYFSKLYQGYVSQHQLDIYSRKLLPLPQPIYIIFYNGDDNVPEHITLNLSDAFSSSSTVPAVEVVAHVYNINYGRNRQLMERCQRLHDYSFLVQQVRLYTDQGLTLKAAIDHAVENFIQQNIMRDFLLKHRGEVCDVILAEYDHELHVRSEKKLSFEEGVEQERQQSIFYMIQDNLEDNIPPERILQRLQHRYHFTPTEAQKQLQFIIEQTMELSKPKVKSRHWALPFLSQIIFS